MEECPTPDHMQVPPTPKQDQNKTLFLGKLISETYEVRLLGRQTHLEERAVE